MQRFTLHRKGQNGQNLHKFLLDSSIKGEMYLVHSYMYIWTNVEFNLKGQIESGEQD